MTQSPTNIRLSISHGIVIPSPHGEGWKFTFSVDGHEKESDSEFVSASAAKQAMRDHVEQLRNQVMKKICVAYLCSGNSAEALALQLIETLHGSTELFFDEIVADMNEARSESPESFETTTEEELQFLKNLYSEHEYEANSPLWG